MRGALLAFGVALLAAAGSARAQFAITSHTIDGGGGTSSAGGFTLSGTVGQPDASSPAIGGSFSLTGGFWKPASGGAALYAAWAEENLPAGSDRSFTGDANGDGVPNGVHYAFAGTSPMLDGSQSSTAPETVPPGVILRWSVSEDLDDWGVLARWEDGSLTFTATLVEFDNGVIRDSADYDSGRAFYRWEATLVD